MTYSLVLAPFIALIVAQCIKVVIDAKNGSFSFRNINDYGGMPSAHTALVSSLAIETIQTQGVWSLGTAVALVIAFLVIRDAVGFRHTLGTHAKILNKLIKELPDYKEADYPVLNERMGHTPAQALAGAGLGIIIALLV